MNKLALFAFAATLILTGCNNTTPNLQPDLTNTAISSAKKKIEIPVFSRKLSGEVTVQSFAVQQRQQLKLHTFYFKSFSDGADHYDINDKSNDHLRMLLMAETRIGDQITLDPDFDGKVTFDEIKKFVTSKPYIADFRTTFINYSFGKMDKDKDKKLSGDEFGTFNKEIKAKGVPDFKLEDELSEFDYNNNESLAIEEYEDFFMKYLLIKYEALDEI
jgi:hypothetical protein